MRLETAKLTLRLVGVFFACLAVVSFGTIVEPPLTQAHVRIFALCCAVLAVLMFWIARKVCS